MKVRLPLLVIALLGLLAAIYGGLVRIGWPWPLPQSAWLAGHGELMVAGFLGTLIGVERAFALAQPSQRGALPWPYAAPALTALGTLALLTGEVQSASWALLAGGLIYVGLHGAMLHRHPSAPVAWMGLGALGFLGALVLILLGRPVYLAVPAWMAFLVLTIAGERLELGQLLRQTSMQRIAFTLVGAIIGAGALITAAEADWGYRLTGLGALGFAVWLLRYDVARHTVRREGLPRFSAMSLLTGYVWMGASGIMALVWGSVSAGPRYDALIHSLFLGFAFSMIFGHAPIIFPALSGRQAAVRSGYYLHLGLLHLSLLLRVAGDLAVWPLGRRWGGLFNGVAILLFLVNSVRMMRTRTKG